MLSQTVYPAFIRRIVLPSGKIPQDFSSGRGYIRINLIVKRFLGRDEGPDLSEQEVGDGDQGDLDGLALCAKPSLPLIHQHASLRSGGDEIDDDTVFVFGIGGATSPNLGRYLPKNQAG